MSACVKNHHIINVKDEKIWISCLKMMDMFILLINRKQLVVNLLKQK